MTTSDIVDDLYAQIDSFDKNQIAFQVENNDIVHITDIGIDGTATVTVFTSTHPDAGVLFTGTVNVLAHRPNKSEEN